MASYKRDAKYVTKHLNRLCRDAAKQDKTVVLVKGRKVAGFYNSEIEATKVGFGRFGSEPFVVRSVRGDDAHTVVASNFQPG